MIGIALYRGTSKVSRIIRWQTRSCYSHAALIDTATRQVFEAWHKGGVLGWHDAGHIHTPGTVVDVYVPLQTLSADEETKILVWCSLQRGKGYDFRGVLRFLDRQRHVDNDLRWFCSELVFTAFLNLGRALLVHIPAYAVAPAHLAWSPLLTRIAQFTTGQTPQPEAEPAKPVTGSGFEDCGTALATGLNANPTARTKSRAIRSAEAFQAFCISIAPKCIGTAFQAPETFRPVGPFTPLEA